MSDEGFSSRDVLRAFALNALATTALTIVSYCALLWTLEWIQLNPAANAAQNLFLGRINAALVASGLTALFFQINRGKATRTALAASLAANLVAVMGTFFAIGTAMHSLPLFAVGFASGIAAAFIATRHRVEDVAPPSVLLGIAFVQVALLTWIIQ